MTDLQANARLMGWWRRWRADRKIDAALTGPLDSIDWPKMARRNWEFCCTLGHGDIPAATLGVYFDGHEAIPDVPYCRSCAAVMGDEYQVTHRFADV